MLAQPSKDFQQTIKPSLSKMIVMDMDPISKAWAYFMHHTLDTNRRGSDLIAERDLELYLLLTHYPAGVANLDGRKMVKLARSLDPFWLKGNIVAQVDQSAGDMCAHFGLSSRYLNHQVDTWVAAQRFRDRFGGEPPAPCYGRYQYPSI
ncbi:hypothetical protein KIW84_031040 [Lathyrus oleraceus]|uniref:Uncharacterized protein n=1 Tax=Pisum sativum TaxID=3888 RepID=A0A9D5B035_PEA|nr:hypothetical protein KIW84_031040 [Pisum sativum]